MFIDHVQGDPFAAARQGLDALDPRQAGDYVAFRPYELAAALNRLRTLQV